MVALSNSSSPAFNLVGGRSHLVAHFENVVAVSCPEPAKCFAVSGHGASRQYDNGAGSLAFSSDGGVHWSARSIPPVLRFGISHLVCPTLDRCIATVDAPSEPTPTAQTGVFAVTWDAGATWAKVNPPQATYGLGLLSCGDGMHCIATGFVGRLDETPPNHASTFFGLTLVYLSTSDGGLHWRAIKSKLPYTAPESEADCPLPTTCWIVETPTGYEDYVPTQTILVRTSDGGSSWQTVTSRVPRLPASTGISCVGDSFCLVAGGWWQEVIATTSDAGAKWRAATNLPRTYVPVLNGPCPRRRLCSRVEAISGEYCVTARDCWVTSRVHYWGHFRDQGVATELLKSKDGGASWVIASVLARNGSSLAIGRSSCWAGACMGVGLNGIPQIITLSP